MEVHAHSHTARKRWTQYFWEFLMLFLAVFCGFLAENKREHYVEKKRAKQFAKSLIKDLERDTVSFNYCKTHLMTIVNAMDSLRGILRTGKIKQTRGNLLYYYGRQLTNNAPFVQSDPTIKQLVSTGGLRYFTNPEIIEKITNYERFVRWVTYDQNKEVRDQYIAELQGRLFDPDQIDLIKLKPEDWTFANDSLIDLKTGLLSYDPILLQQLNQFARLKSQDLRRVPARMDTTMVTALQLIDLLKNEFHLKEGIKP
jgi:hypothetical protein